MSGKIFMDNTSTTPCDKRVVEKMMPYFSEIYGNPSSQIHEQGVMAQKALEEARGEVAGLVNVSAERIAFTSGATEANNLAILGLAFSSKSERKKILISEVEHFSIYNLMIPLRAHGFEVELLPVDDGGVVTPETLGAKIDENTLLVSVMHGNGEIGTIEPIGELASIAHRNGALFHSDMTASAGWIPIDIEAMGVDIATLSAHNFYGPKGVGALVFSPEARPKPRMYGGWQENGLRSGTENVVGIVGMGEAARLAKVEMEERTKHLRQLQQMLWNGLQEKVRFINFTGHKDLTQRLPGHVSFWVEHIEGESIILFLNAKGIMAASGSACSSNLKAKDEEELVASHVLEAVGVPTDICAGSVTMALGKDNKKEDVEKALEELPQIVERLLMMSPTYADLIKKQK